jgi:ferrous iron transporter FeoB
MSIKFSDLKVGERGRVTGFETGDAVHRKKLLSMGLTPGAEFTVMRFAPFGDPVEIRVRGADLSLRSDEVATLLIEHVTREPTSNPKDTVTIAIAGNPNCGKTTLFNGLTGTHQRVGNWGGVTVEKKVGEFVFANQLFRIVDLPGIHSLDTYDEATSVDERIARDYVLSREADLIINIIDASHLEHSLYLTTQLLEMSAPVAIVLNIMDDVGDLEARPDVDVIRRRLGCPVAALVATKRKQIESLKADILQWFHEKADSRFSIDYPPMIEKAISELAVLIRETPTPDRVDYRWLALRLLEGDGFATRLVAPEIKRAYERIAAGILRETGDESDTIIADSRYHFAHEIAKEAQSQRTAIGSNASDRIDRIVLNRFLGIPIFLAVIYCLFWFTVQLSRAFRPFCVLASETLLVEGPRYLLGAINTPAWITALIADGLGNGLLQVVTFIPIIGFLYLFVSALEESGYMARANFVMDRLMKSLGLPGNAFIPMVIGFGCNVPAIMATRTMERPRDRIVAVLMSPFMSCGGRLAVYTIFAAAFFPERGQFVIFGIYILGILFAMLTSLLMKFSLLPEERSLHILTLPSYHWPKLKNVLINTWIRLKMFIFRVGKFIIPLVFLVKILSAWGTDGSFNQMPIENSVLAAGGRIITPVLAPMGIQQDNWPATVALLTGVLHKVVIVSTLSSIYLEEARHKPHAAADPTKEPHGNTRTDSSASLASQPGTNETRATHTGHNPVPTTQQNGAAVTMSDGKPNDADTRDNAQHSKSEQNDGGVSGDEAKALISSFWRAAASTQAFLEVLKLNGWTLARDAQSRIVLIDPKGGEQYLAQSIKNASPETIQRRMSKLDASSLPSVNEAQEKQRESSSAGHPGPAPMHEAPSTVHPMKGPQHEASSPAQDFDLLGRLNRAAMTVPQNLKALVGMGNPVRLHGASAGLAPALATKFDGRIGALAYLILLLCYPCIATTAATARETSRRWTGFMVFWTISLGYGAAVLFYQAGTFAYHPNSSVAWIIGVLVYFVVLGALSFRVGPQPKTILASPNASSTGTCCGS